jgi:hypothetical protein
MRDFPSYGRGRLIASSNFKPVYHGQTKKWYKFSSHSSTAVQRSSCCCCWCFISLGIGRRNIISIHVPEDDAALYKTIIFVVVVVVVVQFLFTGIESAYTMHTRRGCAPVIYQAVLFSSTSHCNNLLPSKVYKNCTTNSHRAVQCSSCCCCCCCCCFKLVGWHE